jgi:hypothetical protein
MTESINICERHGCRRQARRKFCSVGCRVAHHNGRRQPVAKVRITCSGCGEIFLGRADQKTCGTTCRSRVFRSRQREEFALQLQAGGSAIEWYSITPFSPAELRQKMQAQRIDPGVEYSWRPVSPKKIRVRKPTSDPDQMRFDFFSEPSGQSDTQ